MAKLIQAISLYGPKLDLNQMVQLAQVVEWIVGRTGLNRSEVSMVLQELNEAVTFFNKSGTPVKLPGIGIFSPTVDGKGKHRVGFRPDPSLAKALNAPDGYTGRMKNGKNIGLDRAGYKALWDADHPSDPLEI